MAAEGATGTKEDEVPEFETEDLSGRREEIAARLAEVNRSDTFTRPPWPGRTPLRRLVNLLRRWRRRQLRRRDGWRRGRG